MQHINLYRAQFPVQEKIKVSGKVSTIIIIVAVALIAAASIGYWKIETLRKEYADYQKSVSISERALKKVKDELNKSADDDKLKIDLLEIKDKLRHKQALKEQLDHESVDISTSFYSRFLALSKQDVKGLWLNEIQFSERGQKITLTGSTRDANLFPQYLQKLSKESIFSGVSFSVLKLDAGEKNTNGIINFIISSDKLPVAETPLESALKEMQQGMLK